MTSSFVCRLYQTFVLWLEEPRLHGSDLYLPALPPQYEAARLMQIFMPVFVSDIAFLYPGSQ